MNLLSVQRLIFPFRVKALYIEDTSAEAGNPPIYLIACVNNSPVSWFLRLWEPAGGAEGGCGRGGSVTGEPQPVLLFHTILLYLWGGKGQSHSQHSQQDKSLSIDRLHEEKRTLGKDAATRHDSSD